MDRQHREADGARCWWLICFAGRFLSLPGMRARFGLGKRGGRRLEGDHLRPGAFEQPGLEFSCHLGAILQGDMFQKTFAIAGLQQPAP
ncbi:hypothetical protein CC207_25655 [Pseudomonas sp. DrBHI1]|nr:hypothetical protein CC207_25655 [Pseudomonas sp. DrBHI1]